MIFTKGSSKGSLLIAHIQSIATILPLTSTLNNQHTKTVKYQFFFFVIATYENNESLRDLDRSLGQSLDEEAPKY